MFPCYLTDTAFHIDVADAILPHLQPPPNQVRSKLIEPLQLSRRTSETAEFCNTGSVNSLGGPGFESCVLYPIRDSCVKATVTEDIVFYAKNKKLDSQKLCRAG